MGFFRSVVCRKVFKVVFCVERPDFRGIVGIHSYEAASCAILGQEELLYGMENAAAYLVALEFATHAKSCYFYGRVAIVVLKASEQFPAPASLEYDGIIGEANERYR